MPHADFDCLPRAALASRYPRTARRAAAPLRARLRVARRAHPARRRRDSRTSARKCCPACTPAKSTTCAREEWAVTARRHPLSPQQARAARAGRRPRAARGLAGGNTRRPRPRAPRCSSLCGPERSLHDTIRAGPGPGHDELTLDPVRSRRRDRRDGAARVHPALSPLRLGGARRRGDLGHPGRDDRRGAGARPRDRGRPRRRRHHEPARDHGALGSRHGPTGGARDRLAGPPHGRLLRAAQGRRPRARDHAPHRAAARPVLLRHQARLAARQRPAAARAGRARRARVRHDRQLARLEALARRAAHHRRVEREPHAAARHRDRRLGRLRARPAQDPARRAAPRRAVVARPRRGDSRCSAAASCRSAASRATSRRRCSARPASRRAWRRTPTAPAASC